MKTLWKILLVDDDQEDFYLTDSMLRASARYRVEVDWRSSFAAGLQALEAGKSAYDAALIDNDLGDGTGIAIIREAKRRGAQYPLILLTGRGNLQTDVEAMQAGATFFLNKGEVDPPLLERVIRYAIFHKMSELSLAEAYENEKRLRKAGQSLDALFGLSSLGIAIIDCTYTIRQVNETFARFAGLPADQMTGKNYFELFPSQATKTIFQKVIDDGEKHAVDMGPLDGFAPEKRDVWGWSAHAMKDGDGEVNGLAVMVSEQ